MRVVNEISLGPVQGNELIMKQKGHPDIGFQKKARGEVPSNSKKGISIAYLIKRQDCHGQLTKKQQLYC